MSETKADIVQRLLDWAATICTVNSHVPPSSKAQMARDAAAEIRHLRDETVRLAVLRGLIEADLDEARVKLAAIEAMGYEWRWTKSIDENGEQVGAWVMRHDAAEADANNAAWRKSDGE